MKAMWKAAWGPAAHILDVQGGTSRSLCQSRRPCPRDIDATQSEEFASGGGAKHPILLVPWLCLDHCRVLGMLVTAALYLRGCSQSQIVVTSVFFRAHIGWKFTASSSRLVPEKFYGFSRKSIESRREVPRVSRTEEQPEDMSDIVM